MAAVILPHRPASVENRLVYKTAFVLADRDQENLQLAGSVVVELVNVLRQRLRMFSLEYQRKGVVADLYTVIVDGTRIHRLRVGGFRSRAAVSLVNGSVLRVDQRSSIQVEEISVREEAGSLLRLISQTPSSSSMREHMKQRMLPPSSPRKSKTTISLGCWPPW